MRANVRGTSGCIGGVSLVRQVPGERVAVFIDWQNPYKGARAASTVVRPPVVRSCVDLSVDVMAIVAGREPAIASRPGAVRRDGREVALALPNGVAGGAGSKTGVDVAPAGDFGVSAVTGAYGVGILVSTTPS
jgi:hypothetical protein